MKSAIHLFHRQLQLVIIEGKADHHDLTPALSALIHLDPFQVMGDGELGFLWITEILNSEYEEQQREWMTSEVVQSLGRHFFRTNPVSFIDVEPAWIPPLLGYLSLNEKLDSTRSPGLVALRILATSPGYANFGPMILPILTSSLLPTHPLQARCLALNIFERFAFGWFSPQMGDVPSKDLERLVQAVGDPFQFPDLPLQDGKPVDPPNYDPMIATAVLIEFASSDLWRNHLRRSNFTSFEEIVSTRDGKRTALVCMLEMATYPWVEFLCTAPKISMAIRRLEELQCLNTAEVVIMWAWTAGVVNPVDHDTWQLIGRDTLRFYQTHGMERTIALGRHVTDKAMDPGQFRFLVERHGGFRSGAWNFTELPVLKLLPDPASRWRTYLHLSQVCQLRRLYHLFGYDPTTWREAVGVEEVGEKTGVSPRHSVALAPSIDWACDYP